jgi:hypothetical protein
MNTDIFLVSFLSGIVLIRVMRLNYCINNCIDDANCVMQYERWLTKPQAADNKIQTYPTRMGFETHAAEHIEISVQRLIHSATPSNVNIQRSTNLYAVIVVLWPRFHQFFSI